MRKAIFLLILIQSLVLLPSAFAKTGNQLKEYADTGEQLPNTRPEGFFDGYVQGVDKGAPLSWCIPNDVTNGQLYAVVRKYLKDHPEELDLDASDLVKKALQKAWPCK